MHVIIGSPEYTAAVGVGDVVRDDLTGDYAVIQRLDCSNGDLDFVVGVWIEHDYLEGARHPWELTPLPPWRSIG